MQICIYFSCVIKCSHERNVTCSNEVQRKKQHFSIGAHTYFLHIKAAVGGTVGGQFWYGEMQWGHVTRQEPIKTGFIEMVQNGSYFIETAFSVTGQHTGIAQHPAQAYTITAKR